METTVAVFDGGGARFFARAPNGRLLLKLICCEVPKYFTQYSTRQLDTLRPYFEPEATVVEPRT